jgi:hypothetical protein
MSADGEQWCIRGIERAATNGWHGFRVGWSSAESKTTSKGAFISNAGDHGAAGGRTNFRTAFAKPSFSLLSVTAFAGAFTSLLESPIAMEKPPPQAVSIIAGSGITSKNLQVENANNHQGPIARGSGGLLASSRPSPLAASPLRNLSRVVSMPSLTLSGPRSLISVC